MPEQGVSGISSGFPGLSQSQGQVAHVLLTRSPLIPPKGFTVRLACVKHAASVRPEPGSNSPLMSTKQPHEGTVDPAKTESLAKSQFVSTKGITHGTTNPTTPKKGAQSRPPRRRGKTWHRLMARC